MLVRLYPTIWQVLACMADSPGENTLYTTCGASERYHGGFFDKLSQARMPVDTGASQAQPGAVYRTAAQCRKQSEAAGRRLDEMGA